VLFECVRCTREVTKEECYLIFNRKYCRACEIFVKNDPDATKLACFLARYGDIER